MLLDSRACRLRPVFERGGECVGERIFGGRNVMRSRREKRDKLAVAAARDGVGGGVRGRGVVRVHA